jgi:hypothetical protein
MNKFQRAVCDKLGNWGVARGYIYRRPLGRIAVGFLLESTPYSKYINKFALPICDKMPFLHLGFSRRINVEVPRAVTPTQFVELIEPSIGEVISLSDPVSFIDKFSPSEHRTSFLARREYAVALCLAGRYDEALLDLRICLEQSRESCGDYGVNSDYYKDTVDLHDAVATKSSSAVTDILDVWETWTRREYGFDEVTRP